VRALLTECFVCCSVMVSVCLGPDGQALTLVKDGKPLSVIVTNGKPRACQALAATELQEHIRLMSGATLPIVSEKELKPGMAKVLILVGQSNRVAKRGINTGAMQPESFVVKTVPGALILAGEDGGGRRNARNGTLWAVYDFLQDQLGCRWIWPGEQGRMVPRRTTIEIGNLDITETPLIKIRGIRLVNQDKHRAGYRKQGVDRFLDLGEVYDQVGEDERVWVRRMRMGRSFKLSYGHAFTDWWQKHGKEKPGLFALQADGKRRPRRKSKPDFVKMCVSNPELWEMQLAALRKNAAKGGRGLQVNACENDGSGGFCVCPRCRAWDADPNTALAKLPEVEDGSEVDGGRDGRGDLPDSLSDRYARWYNELAIRAREADPQSRVIAYGYSRYRAPPTKIKSIEPNVWLGYVGFNAYPRPASYRQTCADEWLGWSRLGATVFLRSNSLFYCGEGAPYVVSHQLAEDLQFQVKNGLRATDFDCLQGYWATTGPSYYVLARMLWDTTADPDAVLAEFYGAFGPLRGVVKEYYEYWETFTTMLGNTPAFFEAKRPDRMRAYPKWYSDAAFAKATAILAKAKPLIAKASKPEVERFRNVVLGLKHGRLLAKALADGKTSTGDAGKELLAFRRQIAARNVVNVYWTTSKEIRYRVFE